MLTKMDDINQQISIKLLWKNANKLLSLYDRSYLYLSVYIINYPEIYASTSLSPTEEGYSQFEKEMFAATCAIEHFHIYLYGILITHLVSILRNKRSVFSARIKR